MGSDFGNLSSSVVLWEVDGQADFMLPGGRLYVPQAEKIIPNINCLVGASREARVLLISSADAHQPDDAELGEWPPHCIKGTPGAELIAEARAPKRLVIPNRAGVTLPRDLRSYQQYVLEKNTLNVFDNPNTDTLLDRFSREGLQPDAEFVVFGVATEYCVRIIAEELLNRGRPVALVSDAIRAIDPAKGEQVIGDLRSRGARLLTSEQALSLVNMRPVGSV
ncbi:MAG: isochorismatase family protein [Acidobacteriaceae bacterium]|nr:isochorismatase family protein [Acidobacteriaceae bacterium]